jgi:hypothetical protein
MKHINEFREGMRNNMANRCRTTATEYDQITLSTKKMRGRRQKNVINETKSYPQKDVSRVSS